MRRNPAFSAVIRDQLINNADHCVSIGQKQGIYKGNIGSKALLETGNKRLHLANATIQAWVSCVLQVPMVLSSVVESSIVTASSMATVGSPQGHFLPTAPWFFSRGLWAPVPGLLQRCIRVHAIQLEEVPVVLEGRQ